jgi:hypothetical protein
MIFWRFGQADAKIPLEVAEPFVALRVNYVRIMLTKAIPIA